MKYAKKERRKEKEIDLKNNLSGQLNIFFKVQIMF